MRQSPITRDTLLIAVADTKVKRRVPKRLLECSMRQLHNELIASPYDGGLVGARHDITVGLPWKLDGQSTDRLP